MFPQLLMEPVPAAHFSPAPRESEWKRSLALVSWTGDFVHIGRTTVCLSTPHYGLFLSLSTLPFNGSIEAVFLQVECMIMALS